MVGLYEAMTRFAGLDASVWRHAERLFPVRLTRSWADRVQSVDDPLGRQVFPHESELRADPGDLADPIGDQAMRPVPWVVQKHADRALLLVTRRCHLYCRYCFRREQEHGADPTAAELAAAIDWFRRSGVREAILSGGDPLILGDTALFDVIDRLRPHVPLVRVHTRAPITHPARITERLVAGLRRRAPVWVVVHTNHPDELNQTVRGALASLVDGGLPVLNQSVLLRGVNDDVDTLAALSEALVSLRVMPYYLHHPDPTPGNVRFRVPVAEGLWLHRALAGRVSGIGLPTYVIDPPDGRGKLPVTAWVSEGAGGRISSPVPDRRGS